MLGTPHGKGIVYFLVQHPNQMPGKQGESITIFTTRVSAVRTCPSPQGLSDREIAGADLPIEKSMAYALHFIRLAVKPAQYGGNGETVAYLAWG